MGPPSFSDRVRRAKGTTPESVVITPTVGYQHTARSCLYQKMIAIRYEADILNVCLDLDGSLAGGSSYSNTWPNDNSFVIATDQGVVYSRAHVYHYTSTW